MKLEILWARDWLVEKVNVVFCLKIFETAMTTRSRNQEGRDQQMTTKSQAI